MKLIVLFLLAGACNTGKPDSAVPVADKPDTTLQDTLRVNLHNSFTIELGTSMGTGFSWSLRDSSYRASLSLDSTTVLNNVEGKDDGPDIQVFYFTAIKKGETRLHFIRKRPWRKNDPPDKERIFNILAD